MIKKQDIKSVIKAMRKQRREEELATYGKPISFVRVVKSKKLYSRKAKHKKSTL